jgi:prevent-host-death family protein
MPRNTVGARELKTRLGTYLQRVREGRTLVVTDRGEPVAELRPLSGDESVSAALRRLATSGDITLPTLDSLPPFRAVPGRGRTASSVIADDREDRF